MTALFESLFLVIIHDIFSVLIPTCLHFSQVRKPVLDSSDLHGLLLNAGLGALGSDVLGVQDLTGDSRGSWGFRLWLQLMRCAYLLTLSKYFE